MKSGFPGNLEPSPSSLLIVQRVFWAVSSLMDEVAEERLAMSLGIHFLSTVFAEVFQERIAVNSSHMLAPLLSGCLK